MMVKDRLPDTDGAVSLVFTSSAAVIEAVLDVFWNRPVVLAVIETASAVSAPFTRSANVLVALTSFAEM